MVFHSFVAALCISQSDVLGAAITDLEHVPTSPPVKAFCARAIAFLNKKKPLATPQATLLRVRCVTCVYLFIVEATGSDNVLDALQAAFAPVPPKALLPACVCVRMVIFCYCCK